MRKFTLTLVFFFGFNLGHAQPVAISVTPVLDVDSLASTQAISLRNSVLAELTESYDCVVLSRSRGLALFEEQQALVLNSLKPELLPYPTSADFLVVPELIEDSQGIVLKLSYTRVTGQGDADIKLKQLRFSSVDQLLANGPDQIMLALVDALSLQPKPRDPASKAMFAEKAWAVLPWLDYSSAMPEQGDWSHRLMDQAAEILEQELPRIERVAPEASEIEMYVGATETQAAAIGIDVGADYLLSGAIIQTNEGLLLYAFVVRSRDAVVLAGREMLLGPEFELNENFNLMVKDLVSGLPQFSELGGSSEAANLEEARLLYEIAETFKWRNGGKRLSFYHSLEMYLAARMVAQDTYYENVVLRRMPILIEYHPNTYSFNNNWRTIKQKPEDQKWNNYVLDTLTRTLPQPYGNVELLVLREAYLENGDWERALELQSKLIERKAWDPLSDDRHASEYLRALSLTGRFDEALAFFESVPTEVRGNFLYQQAANNYRRMGDEEKEMATMVEMLEAGKWGTNYEHARFCKLSEKYFEPSEQLRMGKLLEKSFGRHSSIQWHLIKAELGSGDDEAAARRAALLLVRENIGRADFENKEEFRSRLKEIAGAQHQNWPTAASIQSIPREYKIYIQPVGEYDEKLLQNATKIVSDFFGCDVIIRPVIEAPQGRSIFYGNDMLTYYGVPVLRHLNIVRPIPKDGIMQLYYIHSAFSSADGIMAGSAYSIYRFGLGTMFSPEILTSFGFEEKKITKSIASEIIRHFRYYFERSQEIWYDQTPDNEGCVNGAGSSRKDYELGYCPECAMNYASANMQAIHNFAQAIPNPAAYTREYYDKYGVRSVYDAAEAKDLQNYVERVGRE